MKFKEEINYRKINTMNFIMVKIQTRNFNIYFSDKVF